MRKHIWLFLEINIFSLLFKVSYVYIMNFIVSDPIWLSHVPLFHWNSQCPLLLLILVFDWDLILCAWVLGFNLKDHQKYINSGAIPILLGDINKKVWCIDPYNKLLTFMKLWWVKKFKKIIYCIDILMLKYHSKIYFLVCFVKINEKKIF